MNSAVFILAINTICFLFLLKAVNKSGINPLAPVSLFNIGFFYSYFVSGFLLTYDPENFTVYPTLWTAPSTPIALYFIPAWLGLLSFNIGYLLRRRTIRRTQQRGQIQPPRGGMVAAVPLSALLLAIASAIGIFVSIDISLVDLITNIESWELFRNLVVNNWADANYLYVLPVYVAFFHLSVLASAELSQWQRYVLFALVLLTLTILGSRALVLSWIISLLVFHERSRKPLSNAIKLLTLSIVAAAGAILGIIQKITTDALKGQDLAFPFNLLRRLQTSYEQFENLVNLSNTRFSFDLGRSIFEDVFVTYLPRAIFPWKPIDVGFIRGQNILFYDDFWSVDRSSTYPLGIVGELYFNFWYIGIIVGMLGLGWLLRTLEIQARRNIGYLPIVCTMAGTFLAPHRTYGTLLMSIAIFSGFVYVNQRIFARHSSRTSLRHA